MSAGPKLEERRAAQHARLQCELKSCSRFGGFFFQLSSEVFTKAFGEHQMPLQILHFCNV